MNRGKIGILGIAFIVEGGMFVAAVAAAGWLDIDLLPLSENVLLDLLIGTFGAVIPFGLFVFTISDRAAGLPVTGSLRRTILGDMKTIFMRCTAGELLIISLLAGIAEEVMFRGVIQHELGLAAASAVFGLVHFVSPSYVMATAVMGLYIGSFLHMGAGLLAVIHLHFIYDFAALIYLKHMVTETGGGGDHDMKSSMRDDG